MKVKINPCVVDGDMRQEAALHLLGILLLTLTSRAVRSQNTRKTIIGTNELNLFFARLPLI